MRKLGSVILLSAVCLTLSSCSHPSSETSSGTPGKSAIAAIPAPARPAATADSNTWGMYLSAQGKFHGKDIQGHPYIYLIPAGDSAAAEARRNEEVQSIASAVGPIVIPGSLLTMGGPDATQTDAAALALPKLLKAHALAGVVVMIVSDGSQQAEITKAYAPTNATLRFVTM